MPMRVLHLASKEAPQIQMSVTTVNQDTRPRPRYRYVVYIVIFHEKTIWHPLIAYF